MADWTGKAPLWMRALRLPGWRWSPGMGACLIPCDVLRIDAVEDDIAVCQCKWPAGLEVVPDVRIPLGNLRPKLTDPATLDLLRALAGRSAGAGDIDEAEALIDAIDPVTP